ncbi:hypothetical protein BDM02DRAFT_3273665 [Thelephora ganbajun]|uniref:Uncharacterized protein n=1 Tax=Thelephora ganbajun TaxID=370292 RepID=A0ACB6YY94_THEGA|nr:hypothetical protein BDM02DRAFT_3273665 [Thelephora ganbajun]
MAKTPQSIRILCANGSKIEGAPTLARAPHKYWLDRFERQFPHPPKEKNCPRPLAGAFNIVVSTREDPHYEEPEDDRVFQELLVEHEDELYLEPLEEVWDDLVRMGPKYKELTGLLRQTAASLAESHILAFWCTIFFLLCYLPLPT